jgi:hypothetical protein
LSEKRGFWDDFLQAYRLNPWTAWWLFLSFLLGWVLLGITQPVAFRSVFPDPFSFIVDFFILVLALTVVVDWANRPFVTIGFLVPNTTDKELRSYWFKVKNTGGRIAENASCELTVNSWRRGDDEVGRKFVIFSGVPIPHEKVEMPLPFEKELGFRFNYSPSNEKLRLVWDREWNDGKGEIFTEEKRVEFVKGDYALGVTINWQYAGRGYQVVKGYDFRFYEGEVFPQLHF